MALIVDPDLLADSATDNGSTEVYINTSTKKIKLVKTGDLSDDGVTLKCLYSFLKEQWRNDPLTKNLAAFPFPMVPITDEAFELVEGWDFLDATAMNLIRTAGWTVKNAAGAVIAKYAGIIGLGTIQGGDDQLYYDQGQGAVNVVLTGQVNQAVQIYSDPNGDGNLADGYDRRTTFNLFSREYAQTYGKATLAQIGVTTMDSQAYRFPLSSSTDLNITHNDATVGGANDPYDKIVIRYFSSAFLKDVDTTGSPRSFGIVVDVGTHSGIDGAVSAGGNTLTSAAGGIVGADYAGGTVTIHNGASKGTYTISGTPTGTVVTITGTFPSLQSGASFTLQRATPVSATKYQIYEKVQYFLRQAGDIDATSGTVTGKLADALMEFVGPDLKCGTATPSNPNGGGSGVIIMGFSAADQNNLYFRDNSFAERRYPLVVTVTINFGDNLKNDTSAKYWLYFTTLPGGGNDFGEAGAVIVEDQSSVDIAGNVGGVSSVSKAFSYDTNVQGGRTGGTDADVTAVAIGLQTGQYVKATGTITNAGATLSLVAALERNYANPA